MAGPVIYNQFPAANVRNTFDKLELNSNEIFGTIFNMIISQTVFADSIGNTKFSIVDKFRTDGSMYGDTKLFYASDILGSRPWANYDEATNLLKTKRPQDPKMQAVSIDQFRQINITVDNYLSKRAWSTEGAFSTFHSTILARIRQTKNVYDETLINQFIGCEEVVDNEKLTQFIPLPDGDTEADNRLYAQTMAMELANILAEMADISRDYNEYGFMRNYDPSDLILIWNIEEHNKILKLDVPTIFHKDGLFDSLEEHDMPARYFGTVNKIETNVDVDNEITRAACEFYVDTTTSQCYLDDEKITVDPENIKHYFAGELVGAGKYPAYYTYNQTSDVLFKIIHKDAIPFMSAFESATSFFNPRSLTENHYLTWGYSTPTHLKNFPFVTVKKGGN